MFIFFISLVSDFLAVRFSVSSGCVRRRSVSSYASILVLSEFYVSLLKVYVSLVIFFEASYIFNLYYKCYVFTMLLILL